MAIEALQQSTLKNPKKHLWGISMAFLAVSGVLAAIAVFVGGESWKATTTALLIFLLNIFVLIGFASKHLWLSRAVWVLTPIVISLSILYVWLEPDYSTGKEVNGSWVYERTTYEITRDWAMGTWWILGVLALLAFFSKIWIYIEDNRSLNVLYKLTVALGLIIGVLSFFNAGINSYNDSSLVLLLSVLAILELTSAAILLISALIEKRKIGVKGFYSEEHLTALVDSRLRELLAKSDSFEALRKSLDEHEL